jgi:hypothetical protein
MAINWCVDLGVQSGQRPRRMLNGYGKKKVNRVPEFGCCINTNNLLFFSRCVGVKNCLPPPPPPSTNYYYVSRVSVFRCLRRITKSDYWIRHVCLSTRPHGTTRLPLDVFSWNCIFEYFSKICRKIQVSLKRETHNGYFTWRPIYIFDHISPSSS